MFASRLVRRVASLRRALPALKGAAPRLLPGRVLPCSIAHVRSFHKAAVYSQQTPPTPPGAAPQAAAFPAVVEVTKENFQNIVATSVETPLILDCYAE